MEGLAKAIKSPIYLKFSIKIHTRIPIKTGIYIHKSYWPVSVGNVKLL